MTMSPAAAAHRILYRCLPLGAYLRVVSGMFFAACRLGAGRRKASMEYVYHLPRLVAEGDTAIDIGANLGYYSRPLSQAVGSRGHVYAVEPVAPILEVLRHNLRRCRNVTIMPYALGEHDRPIEMSNGTVASEGYFGTGRNAVGATGAAGEIRFTAHMRRGSELFAALPRIDFIKCDVEGYELTVLREMMPLVERHRPVLLVESGGENRRQVIDMLAERGYAAYVLRGGEEAAAAEDDDKDLIFRPI